MLKCLPCISSSACLQWGKTSPLDVEWVTRFDFKFPTLVPHDLELAARGSDVLLTLFVAACSVHCVETRSNNS